MCHTNQEKTNQEKPIEELILNAKCKSSADYEKQMKIVDAVNTSKCKPMVGTTMLGKTHVSMVTSENKLFKKGEIHFTSPMAGNRCWRMICTIAEYNQCIEEMKYHYDIPKWCSYNRADKELLTVENSDYSFYEEKFVYGQDVYVETLIKSGIKYKFGCLSLNGESAILLTERGNMVCLIARVSSKPIKSKEDIELEESKRKQLKALMKKHSSKFCRPEQFESVINDMQESGELAEIILPLEKS